MNAVCTLFDRIVDPELFVRRISLTANHVLEESLAPPSEIYEQLDLFTDYQALEARRKAEREQRERERSRQKAVLEIKRKFGKNAILKGMNFEEGATARQRNGQIGGHKA